MAVNEIGTGAGIGMFADANGDAGIVTATNVYSTGDVGMTNTINGANQSLTVDNYDTNDQTPAGLTNLLTISDGGSVTILDSMGLGRQKGDNSTVNVTGADSSFTVDVPLTIGDAGSSVGALTVADDANATIAGDLTLQDNAKIGDSGALTAAEGGISITSGGSIEVGGSAAAPADTLRIAEGASLTGHGRITGAPTGTVPVSGSTTAPTYSLNIDNEGTIEASNGTLILDGNVSGDGQFLVGANSTLEFGGTVADGVTAMFLPGGGQTIIIDDPADFKGVISSENLESGDAIDLPNVPYIDPGSADLNPDGASYQFETGEGQQNYVLQVVENDQTYDIPINQDVPFEGSFTLTDDGDGGTLVTYSAVSQTGYSVTAVADSLPLNNAGVVKLFYKNIYTNQLTYSGTGFIVGQNLILTAAHVANVTNYSRANGYILWAYAPGRVAALPELLKPVGEQVTFLSPGVPDAKYNSLTDWAYLYVPGPPFSKTQGFSLPSKDIPLKTVTVTGYPGLVQGQNKDTGSVTVHGGLLTYPNKIAASGESGGPVWIENKLNHIKDYVGVHIAEGEALSITKIPAPDRLNPPRHFFLDPPSNAARITSAVVIQTGDADSGQTVQFVLNMSENVAVTGGGPTLILNDGGVATYNAASSTGTELEFDYTVGAGDQTSNLEVTQVNSTQTVQAPGGANVDFTVLDSQPTNLSINSPLVVTSIASPQTGEVGAGQSVQLIVSLNEAVTVNTSGGAPTLWLNDNETATYDATASNPLAGTLVFDYTVGSGDETANLEITSVNLPTGTTIQDAAGYNANFSAADNAPTGLQVGPAYITAITPSQSGDLTAGQTVQLTLAMSQGVTVNTSGGAPTLSLSDGAAATYDATASNPSAGTLVFDYAVGASNYTTDLQVLGYNPNGATVADAYGVNADLSGATQYDLALDVNAAVVASLAVSPTTGEADSGQQITLTLTMSAPVSVDLTGGSPTLSLDDGGAATYDSAASDPSTGTLVFDYTVGASDETPSLAISQVNLNGAAIDDANGHAADLSAAANFTTTLQVGPAFVSSVTPSLTGEIFTAQTDQITLAMSQAVTVDTTNGAPTLSLSDGAVATFDAGASDPSSGALAFDYVVGACLVGCLIGE
jgi:T5SS/PEP-CTERM-associated repeat protein